MTKNLWKILFSIFVVLCIGCNADTSAQAQEQAKISPFTTLYDGSFDEGDILRFIDKEANVVCWVYKFYRGGSISCIPYNDILWD